MNPLTDAEMILQAALEEIDDRQAESLLSRLHEWTAHPGITAPVLQYHKVRLLLQLGRATDATTALTSCKTSLKPVGFETPSWVFTLQTVAHWLSGDLEQVSS